MIRRLSELGFVGFTDYKILVEMHGMGFVLRQIMEEMNKNPRDSHVNS